jgi:hypothetical protein
MCVYLCGSRSQLAHGLRRRPVTISLVRMWVRITPGFWMYTVANVLCCRYRSMRRADHSSRGILPTLMGILCDLETSSTRWPWPALACNATDGREEGGCMGLFTAPVWNSKEFLEQPCAAVKWRKWFRYINLCDPMITGSITLKYQASRFDYLWSSYDRTSQSLYASQQPTVRERRSFLRRWSGRGVKLTPRLNLIPKVRTNGAVPPLPDTYSGRAQRQFYLTLT